MDMLTDSGVNAMSDQQLAAMMVADDSYAGSATYTKLESKMRELFGMHWILPTHQGRACENILAQVLVKPKPGSIVPMNYHFTTTKAHIVLNGGSVDEIINDEGLQVTSDLPFKGNMDIAKLEALVADPRRGQDRLRAHGSRAPTSSAASRFSLENLSDIRKVCDKYGLILVLDACLLADNLYFIKEREEACKDLSIREITRKHGGPLRHDLLLRAQARLRARRRHVHEERGAVPVNMRGRWCRSTRASSPMAACRCARSRR